MDKRSEGLDSIRKNNFPGSQAKFKAKEVRQNLKNGIMFAKVK